MLSGFTFVYRFAKLTNLVNRHLYNNTNYDEAIAETLSGGGDTGLFTILHSPIIPKSRFTNLKV